MARKEVLPWDFLSYPWTQGLWQTFSYFIYWVSSQPAEDPFQIGIQEYFLLLVYPLFFPLIIILFLSHFHVPWREKKQIQLVFHSIGGGFKSFNVFRDKYLWDKHTCSCHYQKTFNSITSHWVNKVTLFLFHYKVFSKERRRKKGKKGEKVCKKTLQNYKTRG